MNALIGLCLAVLATSASGALTPPFVCGECQEFVRKLGSYLKSDANLEIQVKILYSTCQEQKKMAEGQDANTLDELKQNLKTTEDLGENMKMLQEAARKSAEAKQLRYRACPISQMPDTPMPLEFWNTLSPVIVNQFYVKQAEVLCAKIGECGKFSASDCKGDCACRLSKIADVFQTGSTQTEINRFLAEKYRRAENKIELAMLGTESLASDVKVDAEAVRVCEDLESVDEGEGGEEGGEKGGEGGEEGEGPPPSIPGSDSQK